MDPIKVDFSGKGADKGREIVIPPEKSALKIILSVLLALVTGGVVYYFLLPPINLKAIEFYYFIAIVIASFVGYLALLYMKTVQYSPYGVGGGAPAVVHGGGYLLAHYDACGVDKGIFEDVVIRLYACLYLFIDPVHPLTPLLARYEPCIGPVQRHEFAVRAPLDYLAMLKDYDLVAVPDSRQPVRDDDAC